jgi:hypothetical protein
MILTFDGKGWSIATCMRWMKEQQNYDLDGLIEEGCGYWYVGSPYSKYPDGLEAAFRQVCRITGALIAEGINAYSPIAHTHPVAVHSGMDPLDHSIWLKADAPLMRAACGLIVCKMTGWEESVGLAHEIEVFEKAEKPVLFLTP